MATVRAFQQEFSTGGVFLWSNPANWFPLGPPQNGDSVLDGAASTDDMTSLTLSTLTLGADLNISASLSVASLSVSAGTTTVDAGGTLAIGALSTSSPATTFDAAGARAVITVGGTTDPGETYVVAPGAKVVLSVPPASSTIFEISGFDVLDPGQAFTGLIPIVALANPGTADAGTGITTIDSLFTSAPDFRFPSYGDAIELPGTSVASVTRQGGLGLNVVTSAGTYDFTKFATFNLPVNGSQVAFVATHDDSTGLEQITFGNATSFLATQTQHGGPLDGLSLWSNPLNWNPGLPFQNVSVTSSMGAGVADIAGLSINELDASADVGFVANTHIAIANLNGGLFVGGQTAITPILATNVSVTADQYIGTGPAFVDGTGNVFEAGGAAFPEAFVKVANGGNFTIDGDVSLVIGQVFSFENSGTIALRDPGTPDPVTGVTTVSPSFFNDTPSAPVTVELPGTSIIGGGYADGILSVTTSAGSYSLRLGGVRSAAVSTQFDAVTGLEAVTLTPIPSVPCYAAGTMILTERGERPVETLRVGERVVAVARDAGAPMAITWVGWRRIDLLRHPEAEMVRPIRVARDAIAPGVPRRDLMVSPDHALWIDGLLIPARLLVNGTTIAPDFRRSSVTYFHVELERHAILLAENLPAESYLDTGNRSRFHGEGAAIVLHPTFAADARSRPASRQPRAEIVVDATRVEPIWRRLAERAGERGDRVTPPPVRTDPDLRLVVGGQTIRPIVRAGGRYVFILPTHDGEARVLSRATRPSDVHPWCDDRRRLGVAIGGIRLRGRDGLQGRLAIDDPSLANGWWPIEIEGTRMKRWTDGDALLPLPGWTTMVELTLVGGVSYLADASNEAPDGTKNRVIAMAARQSMARVG